MSMDITVLDDNGCPGLELQISVEQHYKLICAVRKLDLLLLDRIANYYEDAEYNNEELVSLEMEIEQLSSYFDEEELLCLLRDFKKLIHFARKKKQSIEAIAD